MPTLQDFLGTLLSVAGALSGFQVLLAAIQNDYSSLEPISVLAAASVLIWLSFSQIISVIFKKVTPSNVKAQDSLHKIDKPSKVVDEARH